MVFKSVLLESLINDDETTWKLRRSNVFRGFVDFIYIFCSFLVAFATSDRTLYLGTWRTLSYQNSSCLKDCERLVSSLSSFDYSVRRSMLYFIALKLNRFEQLLPYPMQFSAKGEKIRSEPVISVMNVVIGSYH